MEDLKDSKITNVRSPQEPQVSGQEASAKPTETAGQRSMEELNAALDDIRRSPVQSGTVAMIVCRPEANQRRELDTAELTVDDGLRGDSWKTRRSRGETANRDMQITLMNARVVAAMAPRTEWSLAGDQLFVDFDLSAANVPSGTRLRVGSATVEITAEPHLGCRKFADRFGRAAVQFVNSEAGKALNLRGVNARVITGGMVSRGDAVDKC